jgi:hypothetical protein
MDCKWLSKVDCVDSDEEIKQKNEEKDFQFGLMSPGSKEMMFHFFGQKVVLNQDASENCGGTIFWNRLR